jgi:peptidoglycan-associated lipoprotein
MTLIRTPLTLAAAGAALLLGACATPSPEKLAATPVAAPAAVAAAPAATPAPAAQPATTAESGVATVDLAASRAASAAKELAAKAQPYVYFDFDSDVIRSEFTGSIDAHARQLLALPQKRLRIEGHTDERGGREYNLALGQRRAESVARSLQLLGVPDSRLEVVSFGAERPKAEGSNESAWAQNRRAALRSDGAERLAQASLPR